MSDTTNKRRVRCKFGILNLAGLMPTSTIKDDNNNNIVECRFPLFSHATYKIKPTFNTLIDYYYGSSGAEKPSNFGIVTFLNSDERKDNSIYNNKHYQRKFKRDVLWDFGDGTKVRDYSPEHTYEKPGYYKITCTLFDANGQGWVNDYSIYVVVKEVLPTELRFDKNYTKTDITCSKIERIARIESLVSNTVDKELKLSVNRIFSKKEHDDSEEIGNSYNDLSKTSFFNINKYWTFLENKQVLFYRSDKIYTNELQPSELFSPRYTKLYCKFFYDEKKKGTANVIGIVFYQVIPYKNIDDNLKTIKIKNPNRYLSNSGNLQIHYKRNANYEYTEEVGTMWDGHATYKINQVYSEDQLPEGVVYCGMRGWSDIFYKNDFYGNNENVFSIFYDIENENITGELDASTNYLNMNPLGFKVQVNGNNSRNVKIGLSSNLFLKPLEEGSRLDDSSPFIDQHFRNSLYKGIDLNGYLIPYCLYDNEKDLSFDESSYYIPKDVNLNVVINKNVVGNEHYGDYSDVNEIEAVDDYHPWIKKIPFVLKNYIDMDISVDMVDRNSHIKTFLIRLVQKPLLNTRNLNIPDVHKKTIDINRLIDAYMIHPMFKETENLKELVKQYAGSFINQIVSESDNFLDNTSNINRCYLSNLISQLKMMGSDIAEYEYTNLEGVNDLKKFVRLLSINHSDLVGHVVEKDYEINISKDNVGKNVGDKLSIQDVFKLEIDRPSDTDVKSIDKYGKIKSVIRDGKQIQIRQKYDCVDLIAHDKYTDETKIINFRNFLDSQDANDLKDEVSFKDYRVNWGWNLLLPDNVDYISVRIDDFEKKLLDNSYSNNQKNYFRSEITRLYNSKLNLIDGYYDFYLLNPLKENQRVGNFINSVDITSKIDSVDEWDDVWGICHDILMKIILQHCQLLNTGDIGEDYDGSDEWESVYIHEVKSFDKDEISGQIQFKDQDRHIDIPITGDDVINNTISGSMTLRGEIMSEGINTLYISLDGILNYVDKFELSDNIFQCEVVKDGIIQKTESYDIIGERVEGKMYITIGGTIKEPSVDVSVDIIYDPILLSGKIDVNCDIYNNDFYLEDEKFDLHSIINVSGDIDGAGTNEATVKIDLYEFINKTIGETWIQSQPYELKSNENIILNLLDSGEFGIYDSNDNYQMEEYRIYIKDNIFDISVIDENGDDNILPNRIIVGGDVIIGLGGSIKKPKVEIVENNLYVKYNYPILEDYYDFTSINGLDKNNSIIGGDIILFTSTNKYIEKSKDCVISRNIITQSNEQVVKTITDEGSISRSIVIDEDGDYEISPITNNGQIEVEREQRVKLYLNNLSYTLERIKMVYGGYDINRHVSEDLFFIESDKEYDSCHFGILSQKEMSGSDERKRIIRITGNESGLDYKYLYGNLYRSYVNINGDTSDKSIKVINVIGSDNFDVSYISQYNHQLQKTIQFEGKTDAQRNIYQSFISSIGKINEGSYVVSFKYDIKVTDLFETDKNIKNCGEETIPLYQLITIRGQYESDNEINDDNFQYTIYDSHIQIDGQLKVYRIIYLDYKTLSVSNSFVGQIQVDKNVITSHLIGRRIVLVDVADYDKNIHYDATISGTFTSDEYSKEIDDIWKLDTQPFTVINDISIDRWGYVVNENYDVELTDEKILSDKNISINLVGNVTDIIDPDNLVTIEVKNNNPKGIYVVLFNVNKTIQLPYIGNDYDIQNLEYHSKINVRLDEVVYNNDSYVNQQIKPILITRPNEIYPKTDGKIICTTFDVIKTIITEEHEEISDSGEITIIPYSEVDEIELTHSSQNYNVTNAVQLDLLFDENDVSLIGYELSQSYPFTDELYIRSRLGNLSIMTDEDDMQNSIQSSLTVGVNEEKSCYDVLDLNIIPNIDILHTYTWDDQISDEGYEWTVSTTIDSGFYESEIDNKCVLHVDFSSVMSGIQKTLNRLFEVTVDENKHVVVNGDSELLTFVCDNNITQSDGYQSDSSEEDDLYNDEGGVVIDNYYKKMTINYSLSFNDGCDIIFEDKYQKNHLLNVIVDDVTCEYEKPYVIFDENGQVDDYYLYGIVDGQNLFYNTNIVHFDYKLPNMVNGTSMFQNSVSLVQFTSELTSLEIGREMFADCYCLSDVVTGGCGNLIDGERMFYRCNKLVSFEDYIGQLNSLTNGREMFYENTSLESLSVSKYGLMSLVDGYNMFFNCTSLTSFDGNLSSLTNGDGMFYNCKLNAESIERILSSLIDYTGDTSGETHILTMRICGTEAMNEFKSLTNVSVLTEDYMDINYKGWNLKVSYIEK